MQGKWQEMFGEKKEAVMEEEVKVKKPRKKAATKKKAVSESEPATKVTKKTPPKGKHRRRKMLRNRACLSADLAFSIRRRGHIFRSHFLVLLWRSEKMLQP